MCCGTQVRGQCVERPPPPRMCSRLVRRLTPDPAPDLVILAARTEDEVSHLELCVYEEATEEAEANLFVHHDLLLPGAPPFLPNSKYIIFSNS